MNSIQENSFAILQNQMNRIESMLVQILQKEKEEAKTKERDTKNNGVALAMRITGYERSTIYSLVSQRAIPHSKNIRGRLKFDEAELNAWWNGKNKPTIQEARERA